MFHLPSPRGFKAAEGKWMHEDPQVSVHSVVVVERDLELLRGAQVTRGYTRRGLSVWLKLCISAFS